MQSVTKVREIGKKKKKKWYGTLFYPLNAVLVSLNLKHGWFHGRNNFKCAECS